MLEGARREWMQDLTGTADQTARDVWRPGNRLDLYFFHSPSSAVAYPPSQSTAVLEIRACLDAGVVAGEYPLTLVGGELIEYEGSRRIDPVLESATLRVLSDLTTSEACQSAPPLLACGIDAAYVSGFLLLRFELGTSEPIDWSVWIVGAAFAFPLVNTRLPVIEPAAEFPVAFPFPAGLGTLAIVTVLTPPIGDPCVDFAVVDRVGAGIRIVGLDLGVIGARLHDDEGQNVERNARIRVVPVADAGHLAWLDAPDEVVRGIESALAADAVPA